MRDSSRYQMIVGLAIAALLLMSVLAVGIYTDWLWFGSLGQQAVYATMLLTQIAAFAIAFVAFLGIFVSNLLLAQRFSERFETQFLLRQEGVLSYLSRVEARSGNQLLTAFGIATGVFFGLIFATSASGQWETILAYLNAVSFERRDPLFGFDVSFYVFTLPFYRLLLSWLTGAIIFALAGATAIYLLRLYRFGLAWQWFHLPGLPRIRAHLIALVALIFLLLAVHHWLSTYELVYSSRGVAFGASYADVHAELPALWLAAGAAVLAAALIVTSQIRGGFHLAGVGVGIWLLVLILGLGMYPAMVQKLEVEPSELAKEKPYLEYNIAMTRAAFGLDSVEERSVPGDAEPTQAEIENNQQTINNIRLWDHRPLLDTYNQIQAIRLYYDFSDVDIDRYRIDGSYRQVMLSARELSPEKLAQQAQTWVNQRLQFTHGYGVVMSPVNEVTAEGLPLLFIKDFPPTGTPQITRPQIYYGEKTTDYVIVNTSADEFDHPQGDDNAYTKYQGEGGVVLDSYLRKLAYAWYFRDGNLLLSNYLQDSSRLLYRRQIQDRARELAPFLLYDSDPYIVIADGRLWWFQDAYTSTDRYPYSEPYNGRFNYLRNSVKVVTNAYDGSIRFYIADPSDPLVATYARIFPSLFTPIDQMPESLRAHVRYPEGLFSVQADVYRSYHMTDPQVFYNREDTWSVPKELYADQQQEQPIEPYYVIMRLEDMPTEEFLLMLPFTPPDKNNMIAWMAARSDAPNYGKLVVYKYPKEKQVYGPLQVESRISQDPGISAQLALWNQGGSRVIRGNLLVFPIGRSNLYVEPIYLQAANSQLPELKRVVVASGNRLAMEPSLSMALAKLFAPVEPSAAGGVAPEAPSAPSAASQSTISPDVAKLVQSARAHYDAAQAALKEGNWAKYGEEQAALAADLKKLADLTGTGQ